MTDLVALQTRKIEKTEHDIQTIDRTIELLRILKEHVPPEYERTFALSLMGPAVRRKNTVVAKKVFWSDTDQVAEWMGFAGKK